MGHDHHGHGDQAYYTEQLFNIAVCGAIGAVMVLMYFNGMVRFLFGENNREQHWRVVLGGFGLLAIVLSRAVYVWFSVGKKPAAAHVHDHGDCGHDHGDCGHDHHHEHEHHEHDHVYDHDHGWAPWRLVLLLLPVVLFLLGLPKEGFNTARA